MSAPATNVSYSKRNVCSNGTVSSRWWRYWLTVPPPPGTDPRPEAPRPIDDDLSVHPQPDLDGGERLDVSLDAQGADGGRRVEAHRRGLERAQGGVFERRGRGDVERAVDPHRRGVLERGALGLRRHPVEGLHLGPGGQLAPVHQVVHPGIDAGWVLDPEPDRASKRDRHADDLRVARGGAIGDPGLWEAVDVARAEHPERHPGPSGDDLHVLAVDLDVEDGLIERAIVLAGRLPPGEPNPRDDPASASSSTRPQGSTRTY